MISFCDFEKEKEESRVGINYMKNYDLNASQIYLRGMV